MPTRWLLVVADLGKGRARLRAVHIATAGPAIGSLWDDGVLRHAEDLMSGTGTSHVFAPATERSSDDVPLQADEPGRAGRSRVTT
jgi:hypothetical protein